MERHSPGLLTEQKHSYRYVTSKCHSIGTHGGHSYHDERPTHVIPNAIRDCSFTKKQYAHLDTSKNVDEAIKHEQGTQTVKTNSKHVYTPNNNLSLSYNFVHHNPHTGPSQLLNRAMVTRPTYCSTWSPFRITTNVFYVTFTGQTHDKSRRITGNVDCYATVRGVISELQHILSQVEVQTHTDTTSQLRLLLLGPPSLPALLVYTVSSDELKILSIYINSCAK